MVPEDKLAVFMATANMNVEAAKKLAEQLSKTTTDFHVVFRKHPRDNTDIGTYRDILSGYGLKLIDEGKMSTDQVAAAADIIITTTSTEGLHGVYRRKPTIHINDEQFLPMSENLDITLPLPAVKLGASIGVKQVNELALAMDDVLAPGSTTYQILKGNMEKHYPCDGKNAERVLHVMQKVLDSK